MHLLITLAPSLQIYISLWQRTQIRVFHWEVVLQRYFVVASHTNVARLWTLVRELMCVHMSIDLSQICALAFFVLAPI